MQRLPPFFARLHRASLAPPLAAAVLLPCRRSPPARRSRSRQRSEKTEGKIKGRGTVWRRNSCLHVGGRGTRGLQRRAVRSAEAAYALNPWRALSAGLARAVLEFML